MRIGQSKGWHLLWPKSHLCLDNITPQATPTDVPVHCHPSQPLPPDALGERREEAAAPMVTMAMGEGASTQAAPKRAKGRKTPGKKGKDDAIQPV